MALERRKFLQVGGLAALARALPACGSGVLEEPEVTVAGFGENTTGTVTMWCRGATAAGVQVAVDNFRASQDRVRIKLTPVPDGQYVTKLATAIRGRRVPDLVDIDDIDSTLFMFRDAFTDLTPLVEALPYRRSLSPCHLGLATGNDPHYGVPYLADDSLLWYNTELPGKAGGGSGVGGARLRRPAGRRAPRPRPRIRRLRLVDRRKLRRDPRLRRPAPCLDGRHRRRRRLPRFAAGHIEGNEPLRRTLQFYRSLVTGVTVIEKGVHG